MKYGTIFEHALRRRKNDVSVLLCEIWSIRGSARCAFWATFRPRFEPRDEAHAGVAMQNGASRRCVATSFLRRSKSDVTVLLCEICHTRGWGSKTRAGVALVEPCEITKNRNYDCLLIIIIGVVGQISPAGHRSAASVTGASTVRCQRVRCQGSFGQPSLVIN